MEIKNHLFSKEPGIGFIPSPNFGPDFPADSNTPDTIVLHYTAGSNANSAIQTFINPLAKASAHLIIDRNGAITQMVPFNKIAWHAGESQYEGRIGFNKYSIGIEIDNAGPLEKRGDKYVSWFNRIYPENEVVYAVHRNEFSPRYWHAYTEIQIEKVMEICYLLMNTYPVKNIFGHEEISPGRKTDPGPAFPLEKIRSRLIDSKRDSDGEEKIMGQDMNVTTDGLNIRELPDINSEKVAKPLVKNQKVRVIEKKNGWIKVTTTITGWVAERYLK